MLDLSYIDRSIVSLQEKQKKIEELFKHLGIALNKEKAKANVSREFNLKTSSLKQLKVAAIMDRFTLDSYAPECELLELTPDHWKNEIDTFGPDLIFVESAWKGKDDLWYRKIANGSKEYFEMTSYCQEKNIPIIFWNKEDPVYTDTFMNAARMADFVFTTDIDCIKKYKKALKHDNVYHLHFAAQPKIHNPIEKYDRKDKYCFAGAYYHKYTNRCKIFDEFAKFFIDTKGYDIYDRNYKNALPEHAFPKMYNDYILGKLDPSEIDIAYKGYNFGINMNSVEQSQTMFARRVFEMLASNTVTIGNYSRGVKNLFGDLTICTNDVETLKQYISKWCDDPVNFRKYRLLGLRRVLSQHLYEDRLAYIVEKVFGKDIKKQLPEIVVVAEASTKEEAEYLIKSFNKQVYAYKKLYIVTEADVSSYANDQIVITQTPDQIKVQEQMYYTKFKASNYYGKNYLLDLALNTRYGDFNGVGKVNYYTFKENEFALDGTENTYRGVNELALDRAMIKAEALKCETISNILQYEVVSNEKFLATDEFNFCEAYSGDECEYVDDLNIDDQGIALKDIQAIAEKIEVDKFSDEGMSISGSELFDMLTKRKDTGIQITKVNGNLVVDSTLKDDGTYYIDVPKCFNISDFKNGNKLSLLFQGMGSLDSIPTCIFYDQEKKKISPAFNKFNRIFEIEIPENAVYFRVNIRIKGSGQLRMSEVVLGATQAKNERDCFLSRSNTLVLTNHYPTSESLYRNMFVHKRVLAYKEEGLVCDVMRMNIYAKEEYREFEGINVVEGQSQMLNSILENSNIDTVCVHFLDKQMWEVLKAHKDKLKIIIWVHGAEIQPWWRREFNYTTEEEKNRAKVDSETRMTFWKNVFSLREQYNLHFVFVSQYFADMVMEDYQLELAQDTYSIIHNCIDSKVFYYEPKDSEQRKHIISIRPYSSKIYGNDLTVKTILELSKREFFKELRFTIIGDGELFDETVRPIRKFENVEVRKQFLRHSEISKLYRENGIVLIPTRGDTQGVSRDEAMCCGCVPITNNVAAIPEFTDETCAILAESENVDQMVDGITKLYQNANLFLEMSRNATERVNKQSIKKYTIDRELLLIKK